jgi:hypothetical protein
MIDCVQHIIIPFRKEEIAVLRRVEILAGNHVHNRVDVSHTLGHDQGLWPSDGIVQRQDLSIDVGQTDIIEIDEDESADACPTEGLGGMAADPSQTEDSHG